MLAGGIMIHYQSWASQQLVRVEHGLGAAQNNKARRTSVLSSVSGYSSFTTLFLGVTSVLCGRLAWYLLALVGAAVTLACARWAGWHAHVWSNTVRLLNIFLRILTAFGSPAAAIMFVVGSVELPLEAAPDLPLALLTLWLFLAMASVLSPVNGRQHRDRRPRPSRLGASGLGAVG